MDISNVGNARGGIFAQELLGTLHAQDGQEGGGGEARDLADAPPHLRLVDGDAVGDGCDRQMAVDHVVGDIRLDLVEKRFLVDGQMELLELFCVLLKLIHFCRLFCSANLVNCCESVVVYN